MPSDAGHAGRDGGGGAERAGGVFSSHGLTLLYLAANPDATLRAAAAALGLTERRVAGIVKDLAAAGLVAVERRGRRNHYAVAPEARLRHPTLAHVPLGRIVAAFFGSHHHRQASGATAELALVRVLAAVLEHRGGGHRRGRPWLP